VELGRDTAADPERYEMLDNTEITTSGSTVVINNEVDVDTITPVIEQFVTLFVARAGQSSVPTDSSGMF
jgi:hypothetical protein